MQSREISFEECYMSPFYYYIGPAARPVIFAYAQNRALR
jgi:hypothetical protein